MTSIDRKMHWEGVYRDRPPEETSWHQDNPQASLRLIESSGAAIGDPLIDIGGGASRLVDNLLARGFPDVTVLDISGRALEEARVRLGPEASRARWIEADVTAFEPERSYRLWHDRAAFHFLTDPADRRRYRAALSAGLEVGGSLVIAAFAPDGPPRCSGLEVVRYDAASLASELGSGFVLEEESRELHRTPQGKEQRFGFYRFRRRR
jgi:hypothetical protein